MKYTLATAAIATGKSKATIHRAVKSGKISSTRTFSGIYEIDASELHRVFEIINVKQNDTKNDTESNANDTMMNVALLAQENEFLRQQLNREKDLVNNLTTRLDFLESRINSLLLLLTHQPTLAPKEKCSPQNSSLWKRIFKR